MIRMTRVPEEVTRLLAPLKPYFSYRHHLVFCWLLVAHLMCFGKATVQGLARYTPTHVAAWHLRRLLAAGRWPWARVLEWLVSETLAAFPPPKDGVLYLVVDSTLKGKRTKQNPLVKKRSPQRVCSLYLWPACRHPDRAVGCVPRAPGLSARQTQGQPGLSIGERALSGDASGGCPARLGASKS